MNSGGTMICSAGDQGGGGAAETHSRGVCVHNHASFQENGAGCCNTPDASEGRHQACLPALLCSAQQAAALSVLTAYELAGQPAFARVMVVHVCVEVEPMR